MSKLNFLDFDLKLVDYAKLVVLVGDLLQPSKSYECDIYDDEECHHQNDHNHKSKELKTKDKCSFCKFLEFVKSNFSIVKVTDEELNTEKFLSLRFKTLSYPVDILDWSEFQPWRSPYCFIGYSTCYNKSDLLKTIKNFNDTNEKFRKTLICSKLVIELRFNLEEKNSFQENIIINNSNNEKFKIERKISIKNFDNLSLNLEESNSLSINENTLNNDIDQSASIFKFGQNETDSHCLLRASDTSLNETEIKVNEKELNEKLKSIGSDLVYLEKFSDGIVNPSDISKIQLILENSMSFIHKKLTNLTKIINPLDEKQINNYSEFLKTPLERASNIGIKTSESTLSNSSLLSIKVVNKKTVSARMHKYKADLLLGLNNYESALFHYSQASNQSKKEQDNLWYYSAMEGLCVTSYFLLRDSKSLMNKNESDNRKSSIIDIKNSIKRRFSSKDLYQFTIPFNEFSKQYQAIVSFYHKNELSKFLTVEVSLMIAKYFLQSNMRTDALPFINQAIYVNNLQVSEEVRIKRYYEIGKLYEWCELKRLCLLYKWISATRWSRLIDPQNRTQSSIHRDCLIKRCAESLIESFPILKIFPQNSPKDQSIDTMKIRGSPASKMHILNQLINIFKFTNNTSAKNQIIKYLVNEMGRHLSEEEFKRHADSLLESCSDEEDDKSQFSELLKNYDTKFFNVPKLNSLTVIPQTLGPNVMGKIKIIENQLVNGIYIHRYENPLYSQKPKKIYTLRIDTVNKIQMILINLFPIDLNIDSIDLILNSKDEGEFLVELFDSKNPESQNLVIPANKSNIIIEMNFILKKLGNFQIIGYEIRQLNISNKILFNDLIPRNTSIRNTNSLIETSYDLEVIPKLPLIREIDLISEDSKKTFKIIETKKPSITSKLGICQHFKIRIECDYKMNDGDLNIIESKCSVLNDQLMASLNVDVCLEEDQNNNNQFYLKVDTSDFPSDKEISDLNNLELPCSIELKYSNKLGHEKNMCYTLRKQFFINFEKVFQASIKDIDDIHENHVAIVISVKNLSGSSLYCDSDDTIEILPNTEYELKKEMKKIKLKMMLSKPHGDSRINFISALITENLNLKFSIRKNCFDKFLRLKFENQINLTKFKNFIFQSPVTFKAFLSNIENNCLILIASKQFELIVNQNEEYKIEIKLKNRLKHKVINNFLWELVDFTSNTFWVKEYKFLSNDEKKIEFSLTFTNKESKSQLLQWNYQYNFITQTFSYLLN